MTLKVVIKGDANEIKKAGLPDQLDFMFAAMLERLGVEVPKGAIIPAIYIRQMPGERLDRLLDFENSDGRNLFVSAKSTNERRRAVFRIDLGDGIKVPDHLGRACGALLRSSWDPLAAAPVAAGASASSKTDWTVWKIPIEKIQTDPTQPRQKFNQDALARLRRSIQQDGLKFPIHVKPSSTYAKDGIVIVVAGERRLRCARKLDWKEVPCFFMDPGVNALLFSLVENLVRENLNPIEEARGYQRLVKDRALNQMQVAQLVGMSDFHVSRRLLLLNLPQELQSAVAHGKLSAAAGVELASRCRAQSEMSAVFSSASQKKHGNVSKVRGQTIKRILDTRDQVAVAKGHGVREASDPSERAIVRSAAPVGRQLLTLLDQLLSWGQPSQQARDAFLGYWKAMTVVEQTALRAVLTNIAVRQKAIEVFLKGGTIRPRRRVRA